MRSLKAVVLGALSLLGLAGCNFGQPRLYRVALDETPIRTIAAPTCFRNSNLPGGRGNVNTVNYRTENEWVIWAGTGTIEYLDLGQQTYNLGDAPTITVSELIEGNATDRAFSGQRTVARPFSDQYTEQRQTSIQVKFDDYSFSPVGSVTLNSTYACIDGSRGKCPTGDQAAQDAASCSATLNFVARRIDYTNGTSYTNNP
jgi:hypothetical protein